MSNSTSKQNARRGWRESRRCQLRLVQGRVDKAVLGKSDFDDHFNLQLGGQKSTQVNLPICSRSWSNETFGTALLKATETSFCTTMAFSWGA